MWKYFGPVILVALRKLSPHVLKSFVGRLSKATQSTIPGKLDDLMVWLEKHPGTWHTALYIALEVGGSAVMEYFETPAVESQFPKIKSVLEGYKSTPRYQALQREHQNTPRIEAELTGLVGDKRSGLVHGLPVDDFVAQASFIEKRKKLYDDAISIVGSRNNFLILQNAFLTLESEELDLYRQRR